VNNQRPKNLNLFTIRFPIPAIVSILHRISGFLLFLLIPFLLWSLQRSLASEDGFDQIHQLTTSICAKIIILGTLSAFIFHFVAGIRHLLMDIHIGEELKSGRIGAILTIIISILLILITGIVLW
jgi:succinate dehydrogenase / fumarate reductase cytochrome b subunit